MWVVPKASSPRLANLVLCLVLMTTLLPSEAALSTKHRKDGRGRVKLPSAVECLLELVQHVASANAGRGVMVQIGAHLAWMNINDPFKQLAARAQLRTVLVEPQPNVFAQLKASVVLGSAADHRVINAAVCPASRGGANVTFYSISPEVNPLDGTLRGHVAGGKRRKSGASYTSQIASMSLDHVLKHKRWIPNLEDYIVEIQVPCLSVSELLQTAQVHPSDVLVLSVDAEGYDDTILLSVDFETMRPFLIVFEFMHLAIRQQENATKMTNPEIWARLYVVERHLLKFGYTCWKAPPENFFCTSPHIPACADFDTNTDNSKTILQNL